MPFFFNTEEEAKKFASHDDPKDRFEFDIIRYPLDIDENGKLKKPAIRKNCECQKCLLSNNN